MLYNPQGDPLLKTPEVLATLSHHREELQATGFKSLAVFGSLSRGEATAASDIDLLVEFSRPVGLLAFARLRRHLSEILGRPVDLVTPKALRPPWRERILGEARYAIEKGELGGTKGQMIEELTKILSD